MARKMPDIALTKLQRIMWDHPSGYGTMSVWCRGGSRYVEGCWGFAHLKIKKVSWFLGVWFLCFKNLGPCGNRCKGAICAYYQVANIITRRLEELLLYCTVLLVVLYIVAIITFLFFLSLCLSSSFCISVPHQ